MFAATSAVFSKTSFQKLDLIFLRNHQVVTDTTNGTVNVPHVEIPIAMIDDETQNCFRRELTENKYQNNRPTSVGNDE